MKSHHQNITTVVLLWELADESITSPLIEQLTEPFEINCVIEYERIADMN